jgi:hypothetical protein
LSLAPASLHASHYNLVGSTYGSLYAARAKGLRIATPHVTACPPWRRFLQLFICSGLVGGYAHYSARTNRVLGTGAFAHGIA